MSRSARSGSRVVLTLVLAASLLGPAAAGSTGALAGGPEARVTWIDLMTESFEGEWPAGLWSVYDADGAANGEYLWDDDHYKPHTGARSAWGAAGGADALDPAVSDYPTRLHTWMKYGPFDLRGYSAARLTFYYWNSTEPVFDGLFWGASADNANFDGGGATGDSGGWQYQELDLTPYAGLAEVWIAFVFNSDSSIVQGKGSFVDDVALQAVPQAPATIDARFRSAAAYDGWVRGSGEGSGLGGTLDAGSVSCRVGDDAADRQYRILLDFNTRSLPDDAVITNVVLQVKRSAVVGTDPMETHGDLLVDIRRGRFGGSLSLEAGDFEATPSRAGVGRVEVASVSGWHKADLGAGANARVNLSGHTQFRLRFAVEDDDDLGADYLAVLCGDTAQPANRPLLTVTYYVP